MKIKKLMWAGVLLLGFVGCQGKQGARGLNGENGAGNVIVLSGDVLSDEFIVTEGSISRARLAGVYVSSGNEYIALPVYLPAIGVNAYYIANLQTSVITFYNLKKAGATKWTIALVI